MRALLVTRAGVGGAARHVLDVVGGLATRHEIAVAASPLEDPGFLDRLRESGARVFPLAMARGPHPVRDLTGLAALRGIVAEFRPDLVHAHTFKAGLLARLAVRRVPVLYSPHGFFHLYPDASATARAMARAVEKRLARRTGLLVLNAKWERSEAPAGPAVVVPNGVRPFAVVAANERESARAELQVPENGRLLLMVGRLKAPKAPGALLEAAGHLPPECVVALAGDGPLLEECRASAPPNARVLGRRDDIPRLLAAADLAVLATRFEASPYFLLEAATAAVPVAATDLPATRELLGGDGLLLPPDSAGMARALAAALADPGTLAARARRLRDRIAGTHSISRMLTATEAAWAAVRGG